MYNKENKITFLDLFAGAGGFSEGFIQEGFLPVAFVEKEKNQCFTLKTRVAYYYLKENDKIEIYYDYLQNKITRENLYSYIPNELLNTVIREEITQDTIQNIFKKIDATTSKIDVIIGGPPCQAYSKVGRCSILGRGKDITTDKRLYLYSFYANFLEKYDPKLFIFENVSDLLNNSNKEYFNDMINLFENLGYSINYKVLNSSDYYVPQMRKRVFIVGTKKNIQFSFPEKLSHSSFSSKQVFYDLPQPNQQVCYYSDSCSEYLDLVGIRTKDDPFTTQHITRVPNEKDREIYRIAIEMLIKNGKRLKYSELPNELKSFKNENFQDRYKVIDPDTPSHTVMAHLQRDGHYYIYPDLRNPRSITVREAARLQTFPDDYFFEGGMTSAFQQIGNAVPIFLARVIAKQIRKYFILTFT